MIRRTLARWIRPAPAPTDWNPFGTPYLRYVQTYFNYTRASQSALSVIWLFSLFSWFPFPSTPLPGGPWPAKVRYLFDFRSIFERPPMMGSACRAVLEWL